MKRNTFQPFFYLFFDSKCTAKQTKTDTLQVVITSSRIDLPKENSRTIQLITAEDIKNPVTNVADALQQIAVLM
jgi:outer membrane receptor for ferrienterochelin and colicin